MPLTLTDGLGGISPEDLALLRLCTARPTDAPTAWQAWLGVLSPARHGEPPYPTHWRNVLALVAWHQNRHSLAGPDGVLSRLRMAALLEERRLAAVHRTTRAILDTPFFRDARPLVVGTLAFGETLYPHPATRHTGLLCLMLRAGTCLRRVRRHALAAGYRVRRAGVGSLHLPFSKWATLWLSHPSGFHLEVMSAPFWRAGDRHGHARMIEGAQTVEYVEAAHFLTPAPHDAWALACGGMGRDRQPGSLLWLVDAVFLGRRLRDGTDEERALFEKSPLKDVVSAVDGGLS